jgi:thiol-disulfide isomerase/thioredoxin
MRKGALAVLLGILLLSGCNAKEVIKAPGVKVDTPALRTLKQQAHIETCPTTAAGKATDGLPDVTLPCLGGGPSVNLARLRGPLVVNFWAQSCGPCRKELPEYQAFSRTYAGKVGVLGIDWQDTQPDLAIGFARETGATYPQLTDVSGLARLRPPALPQLYLIDAAGKVVFREAIQITSEQQLEHLVATHLGVSR